MKIDHVAIFVRNLEATKNFYVKYFNAAVNNKYRNNKTLLETYFLSFDSGTRLEIMSRPDLFEGSNELLRTGLIHLSFKLGSEKLVDSKVKQLESDGYKIISNPRTTGDGYYEACVSDNEGNFIEIIA
ncbi:VOC family protein [Opitutia bacterium KCR 482]|nr:VOC family protein [Opitutae bacterium KCR 482]